MRLIDAAAAPLRHARRRIVRAILWALLPALAALPAAAGEAAPSSWRAVAAPYDIARIARLEEAVARGDAEAEGKGSGYAQAVAKGLMGAPAGPVDTAGLAGLWRCRTIKVGGPYAGLVVYGWFTCRIAPAGAQHPPRVLRIEKLTGSQRFAGHAWLDGPDRLVLLAGGFYHYEPARPYQAKDSARGPSPDNRDKVAVIHQLGPDWLRAVFPFPARESTYDIVEFRRAD